MKTICHGNNAEINRPELKDKTSFIDLFAILLSKTCDGVRKAVFLFSALFPRLKYLLYTLTRELRDNPYPSVGVSPENKILTPRVSLSSSLDL